MDVCVIDFWLIRFFGRCIIGTVFPTLARYRVVVIVCGDPGVTRLPWEFGVIWGPCLLNFGLSLVKLGK